VALAQDAYTYEDLKRIAEIAVGHREKSWVRRSLEGRGIPGGNESVRTSTYSSDGKHWVVPTIREIGGEIRHIDRPGEDPWRMAQEKGDAIGFNSLEEAESFSKGYSALLGRLHRKSSSGAAPKPAPTLAPEVRGKLDIERVKRKLRQRNALERYGPDQMRVWERQVLRATPIGFWEAFGTNALGEERHAWMALPFFSSGGEAAGYWDLYHAAQADDGGRATPEQVPTGKHGSVRGDGRRRVRFWEKRRHLRWSLWRAGS
jgi:hypothetical protein